MATALSSPAPIRRERMSQLGNIFASFEMNIDIPESKYPSLVGDTFKMHSKARCIIVPSPKHSGVHGKLKRNLREMLTKPRPGGKLCLWEIPRYHFAVWQIPEGILGRSFRSNMTDVEIFNALDAAEKNFSFEQFWLAQQKVRAELQPHQDRRIMGLVEVDETLVLVSVLEKRTGKKAGEPDDIVYEIMSYDLRDTVEKTIADYLLVPPFVS